MIRSYTPEQPVKARTEFEFTDKEVAQILVEALERQGEKVPMGHRFVVVRDRSFREDGALATLIVDHEVESPRHAQLEKENDGK
jgi:hypothetical protein